jgi:hypothetical protein
MNVLVLAKDTIRVRTPHCSSNMTALQLIHFAADRHLPNRWGFAVHPRNPDPNP